MCQVCDHKFKSEIESSILDGVSYEDVAIAFDLNEEEIKKHCIMHLRIGVIGAEDSKILNKAKSKELLLLQQGAFSYFLTMKSLERVIQQRVSSPNFGNASISKAMVDLYLGAGNNMRQMIDSLFADMNILTGDGNQGLNALSDLVMVLQKSKAKAEGADK